MENINVVVDLRNSESVDNFLEKIKKLNELNQKRRKTEEKEIAELQFRHDYLVDDIKKNYIPCLLNLMKILKQLNCASDILNIDKINYIYDPNTNICLISYALITNKRCAIIDIDDNGKIDFYSHRSNDYIEILKNKIEVMEKFIKDFPRFLEGKKIEIDEKLDELNIK